MNEKNEIRICCIMEKEVYYNENSEKYPYKYCFTYIETTEGKMIILKSLNIGISHIFKEVSWGSAIYRDKELEETLKYGHMDVDKEDQIYTYKFEENEVCWVRLGDSGYALLDFYNREVISELYYSVKLGKNRYGTIITGNAEFFIVSLKQDNGRVKEGVIDKTGKEVIPCAFDSIAEWSPFYTNPKITIVQENNKKGLASIDGELLCGIRFDDIFVNADTKYVLVKSFGMWAYYDYEQRKVITPFKYYANGIMKSESQFFSCGYAKVQSKKTRLCTWINKEGKEICKCQFSHVYDFKNGYGRAITSKHKTVFIDANGYVIYQTKKEEKDAEDFGEDGFAYIHKDLYINMKGEEFNNIEKQWHKYQKDKSKIFQSYQEEDKVDEISLLGIKDMEGNTIIKANYFSIEAMPSHYFVVTDRYMNQGFIDWEGDIVGEIEYDSVEDFHENKARVTKLGKTQYLLKNGKILK